MHRSVVVSLLCLLLAGTSPARADAPAIAPAVENVVQQADVLAVAHWGFILIDAASGNVLYQHDADHVFVPASNMKLLVGAAAFRLLGPEYRYRTEMLSDRPPLPDGTLDGNLYLKGYGDPSLSTDDLKQAVSSLGLHSIRGDLVVDDSFFEPVRLGPGWSWDDQASDYSAQQGAICLNRNTVHIGVTDGVVTVTPDAGYVQVDNEIRTGTEDEVDASRDAGTNQIHLLGTLPPGKHAELDVAIDDPALYAAFVLRSEMAHQGITISGKVRRGAAPADGGVLWQHLSAPLMDLLSHMLKHSDNLYAEQFLKTVGGGTREAGIRAELQAFPLDGSFRVVDGSGLSRYNLISPRQIASIVQRAYLQEPLRAALPVAGQDGTLGKRLTGDAAAGHIFAKTGTISGVSSLSGVMILPNGHSYVFSWMTNAYVGPSKGVKSVEDQLIHELYRLLTENGK